MDKEKIIDNTIDLTAPTIGEVAGALVGSVVAGVPGAVTGAIVGTTLGSALKIIAGEIKEHVLSTREKRNLENILNDTINNFSEEDMEKIGNNDIDEDWLIRFYNITKDISSKELQIIWGKILANEIKRPGKYSLRILDVLRNISKEEAECFNKIRPLILYNKGVAILPKNGSLLSKFGIDYNELLPLEECGILNARGDLAIKPEISSSMRNMYHLYSTNRLLQIRGIKSEVMIIQLPVFTLTSVGKELFYLLDTQSNIEFIEAYCNELVNENRNTICISLFDFTVKNGTLPLLKTFI